MNTRSRESSATSTRKSVRVRQKRTIGQDYVDPEDYPIEEVSSEPTAKRQKTLTGRTRATSNQQLNEMVATAIAINEIKQEEDFVQKKPAPAESNPQKKWCRPEVRRSARHVKPSAKALECDQNALKDIKAEEDEVEKNNDTDVEYYPPVPNMPALSKSFTDLVARCPAKVTVNPHLRKPVMYTGGPSLFEKIKSIKPTDVSRPINRLKQKTFNLAMTPVDGIYANEEPMSPETEKRLAQEAEEAVAQIRAASVQKILEKRSRGKFSSGGQAAAQNKEIERFVKTSANPEEAIERIAESLNRKNTIPPSKAQPRPTMVRSKQPQFVRETIRTVSVQPAKQPMTVTDPRLVKTIRTSDSKVITVSGPLRLAIAPKHRLAQDTQLRIPKEEVDLEQEQEEDKAAEKESQLIDPKVEALEDAYFEKKPETIEPKEPASKVVPGVKRQEPQFSQLPMRMDRKTGKLYVPNSKSLPGATSVTFGTGPAPKYYALKTVSQLKTPKQLGSQIATRTVTVLPKMLYVNKDGSAPGPSTDSDDLPPSLPPNPIMSNRKLRKIITEQTMVRVPPLKPIAAAVPVFSPKIASPLAPMGSFVPPSKPISSSQPVRKILIDPKSAKIVPSMVKRDADGKPIPTRRIIVAHPNTIQKVGQKDAQPEKTVAPKRTSAASRESDSSHNKWNPEFDHAYSKPFSKKPMSPDRIISKTYIPPEPLATPIVKYLGSRDREFRAVTANDNLHPNQPQFIDPEPIEQKPTGLIEEDDKNIKCEVEDDDIIEIPKPETKPTDLVPNFEPRRMVMIFHPPKRDRQEPLVEMEEEKEEEKEEVPERTPSPDKVFLGAQEPMKDLDEDAYKFNRVIIKRCKSFTAKQLRPFGKRPPGDSEKPSAPGISMCMVEEDDEEQYTIEKELEDEEDKQEKNAMMEKLDAEMIRQKEALAHRLVKNEGKIWEYMQTDGFKNMQKPDEQMKPFEKVMLQHDALAKIPAFSESLSHNNPKLLRDLRQAFETLSGEKRNAPVPVRQCKPKERLPQVFGRVSGPIQVNLHDAKEQEKLDDKSPINFKDREPKMVNVLFNDVPHQIPDQITCHLCDHVMRLSMRKSYYRGELREYPAYRCLRKGCQTFRSIKKFIEGIPVNVTVKKPKPLIETLPDPLSKFVPSSREEFLNRKANIEMNLRPRLPSKLAKMSEDFVVEESAADIARKDLEAEETLEEEEELDKRFARQDVEAEEDDELVEWAKFPGASSRSTCSPKDRSPSYECREEDLQIDDDDYFHDNEEEDYARYDYERPSETYNFEDYVEEGPIESLSGAITKEPKEEPIEYDEYVEAPMVREIKEEVIDEAFDNMMFVQETKPEFLLHTSKVNS